ncbi:MAG: MBL fold metallo-hydrolase [Bacteroidales bacterium]|nr:MBL fold metallo-hydrolase [Bacteroidales bacterium]
MLIGLIALCVLLVSLILRANHFGAIPGKGNQKIHNCSVFNGKQFVNPGNVDVSMDFGKLKLLSYQFLKLRKQKRPPQNLKIAHDSKKVFPKPTGNEIQVTWLGHSSVLVDFGDKRLLFDPMLSQYASPIPAFVKRFKNALTFDKYDLELLGKIDAVIISHDHYDHLDYTTISGLKDRVDKFYVPLGVGAHLEKWKIDKAKIIEADWWDEFFYDDLKFVCTPSRHFSGRRAGKRNYTLWASWLVKYRGKSVYFSGDSGYFDGFKEIKEKYGSIDLAMLECGQYNELWKEIHMLPEQTVLAAKDLDAKLLLPIHNMAFSLALHPWYEPKERALIEAKKLNIKLVDILAGEMFEI